jgi:agmatine deiminase
MGRLKLEAVFPDYEVVGIATREILLGGGHIHCIALYVAQGQYSMAG